MTKYVVGFAFSEDLKNVVLIRKNRPKWQAGKLNGVGGHIEEGETGAQAIMREFHEETGAAYTYQDNWRLIAIITDNKNFHMEVYGSRGDGWKGKVASMTDEEVVVHGVAEFMETNLSGETAIFNIPWLMFMSLQMLSGKDPVPYYRIEF